MRLPSIEVNSRKLLLITTRKDHRKMRLTGWLPNQRCSRKRMKLWSRKFMPKLILRSTYTFWRIHSVLAQQIILVILNSKFPKRILKTANCGYRTHKQPVKWLCCPPQSAWAGGRPQGNSWSANQSWSRYRDHLWGSKFSRRSRLNLRVIIL